MKIESFEGIVLSETNYSESSKILNIYTKEKGLIGVMSKGCRNMKSKLRGVSRKLIHGKFHVYYKPNGLSTLIGVDIINSFPKTVMDLEKISYASFILDLTNQVLKQIAIDEGIADEHLRPFLGFGDSFLNHGMGGIPQNFFKEMREDIGEEWWDFKNHLDDVRTQLGLGPVYPDEDSIEEISTILVKCGFKDRVEKIREIKDYEK